MAVIIPRLEIIVLALALFLAATFFSACAPKKDSPYKDPISQDVSESASVGLKFEVQDFKWAYVNGGKSLQVTGTIKNKTKKAHHAVIYAMMFDENGAGVAMGESFITPAYLEPGQSGSFSVLAQTNRPQGPNGIRHLRLLTNAQPE